MTHAIWKEFLLWEMKQGIHLLYRTQKQPKEKWNGFSTLIETKVILLSIFVFYLHASSQLCRIIYKKKKSNLLSLHFYLWWCMQYGKSFFLGVEARNLYFIWNTKSCPTASTMKVEGSLGSLMVMANTSPSIFNIVFIALASI